MSFERDLVKQVNLLRTNPRGFADKIAASRTYFSGNIWKHPDLKAGIKTEEGPAAYDEAIDFLRRQAKPVDELTPSKGLCKIAADFLREYQKDANANVDMDMIIDRHGKFTGNFRRLIEFGGATAEQAVINLVVSDGDKSRGHREALLSDGLKKIGVANGTHDVYRTVSVIVACTQFENPSDSNDAAYL